MNYVADITLPLLAVDRLALGRVLIQWPRLGHRLPVDVSLTTQEVHLALSGCNGPALVVDLDHITKPAIREFEMLMGIRRSHK